MTDDPASQQVDPRRWFAEEELEPCPFCGETAAVPSSGKASVCLSCEVVWLTDGEPKAL